MPLFKGAVMCSYRHSIDDVIYRTCDFFRFLGASGKPSQRKRSSFLLPLRELVARMGGNPPSGVRGASGASFFVRVKKCKNMRVGDRVLISPDVTHLEKWIEGKVIKKENNSFVGIVISAQTDDGDVFFSYEDRFKPI